MELNDNFMIKEIAGNIILVPIGDFAIDFNGVITLNETAKFLWEKCQDGFTEESLIDDVKAEYNVDDDTAKTAVKKFIKEIKEAGCVK